MPVIGAAFGKAGAIRSLIMIAKHLGIGSVPANAITFQIGDVPRKWRGRETRTMMPDDACLDEHPALSVMSAYRERGTSATGMTPGAASPVTGDANITRFV